MAIQSIATVIANLSVVDSRQRPRGLAELKTSGKPAAEGTMSIGDSRYWEPIFKVDIVNSSGALCPLSVGHKRAAKIRMRENTHLVYLIVASAAQCDVRFRTALRRRRPHLSSVDESLSSTRRHCTALAAGLPLFVENHGRSSVTWRSVMKKLMAALALFALIAVPTFATSASAQVSPASSSFGSNGY